MNLRIIYITIGILSTRLLAAQNQTMELTLEQVVNMARLESPDAHTAHDYYLYLCPWNITSIKSMNEKRRI